MTDDAYVQAQSSLLGLQSWVARHCGDMQQAIQLAEKSIDILPEMATVELGMNHVFLGDAYIDDGQFDVGIRALEQSLKYNESNGNHLAYTGISRFIATIYLWHGELQKARRKLESVIQHMESLGQSGSTSDPKRVYLAVLYELDELQELSIALPELWDMIKFHPTKSTAPHHLTSAWLYTVQGDVDKATQSLEQCERAVQNWSAPIDKFNMTAHIMCAYLCLNLPSRPYPWLKQVDTNPGTLHYRLSEGYIGVVDVLRHQNTEQSRQQALDLIDTLHDVCES